MCNGLEVTWHYSCQIRSSLGALPGQVRSFPDSPSSGRNREGASSTISLIAAP